MKQNKKCIPAAALGLMALLLLTGCGDQMTQTGTQPSGTNESGVLETEWEEPSGFLEQMPAFTAKDLDGNTVTDSIFSEKDLTAVNIWGTFCTPCVDEMPQLGEWAKSLPAEIGLMGLIIDIEGDEDTEHRDLAVSITKEAGAEFTQVIANADFDGLLQCISGVPTTVFVDKSGKIVGEPIVGADVEGYKAFVEEYLNGQKN